MTRPLRHCMAIICLTLAGAAQLAADEGMWLFSDPPREALKAKYGFEPSDQWLTHLRQASVRFNSGGSGSFVSAEGLVMTNHHVGADALHKLSTKEKNYVRDGFHANTRADEIRCVDLELNVLMSIKDVTDRVNSAAQSAATPEDAFRQRRAEMNTIEKESLDKTGLRSDVITLYHGGLYHLYRFKKYTDVRLVFAPEQDIAFFGGDPDNFEYPRYDLDICFFRVYENDRPLRPAHWLKWNARGAGDGELVFVSGHPGRTNRLNTAAHLEFMRDRMFPYTLEKLFRREVLLRAFSQRTPENARRAEDELFSVQNSRKARLGGLAGLQDPAVMARRVEEEAQLRRQVENNPLLKESCGDPWADIAASLATLGKVYYPCDLLEFGSAFNCRLFGIARTLVRLAEESGKPNAERLREYRESHLESLKLPLFSEAPIYKDLETIKLADSLSMYLEMAGAGDPLVRQVLAGKSPRQRAAELIAGTRLDDVRARRALADGGPEAIARSDDPMIQLARLVDQPSRELRKTFEEQVEEPQRQAYGRIAKARFAWKGRNVYPDATFTLRLAFGVVSGCTEMGKAIPPWTTIGGAYQWAQEHDNREPFRLPPRWIERRPQVALDTPMNFAFTADIIGGNSGSPVVDRDGALAGIVFDGNLDSLVWDFVYDDATGRAIAVHSAGILEALRRVYQAQQLADELSK